ncbi:MAG: hypothetical protein RRZ67_00285 [Victivallaceae bacterium]
MKIFFLGAMLVIGLGFSIESKEMCLERKISDHKDDISLNREISSETPNTKLLSVNSTESEGIFSAVVSPVDDSSTEKEKECTLDQNKRETERPPYSFYEFGNEYYYPQTANNGKTRCYTYIEDGTVFYKCD